MKSFDYKKATQIFGYLLSKFPSNSVSKLSLMKLTWAMDRLHLRKYGRTITNDDYKALRYGPIPTSMKDIAESSNFLSPEERVLSVNHFELAGNFVKLKASTGTDLLSTSEIQVIDYIYEKLGSLTSTELVDLSHKYPEWAKYSEILSSNSISRVDMNLLDFFLEPEDSSNDIFQLPEDQIALSRDKYCDTLSIEQIL